MTRFIIGVSISCVVLTITFCHTEAPTTKMSSAPMISNGCVKCGVVKKSGKRSCCARGGAWFKNCGDAGDTKFDHTWTEGVHACEDFVGAVLVKSPLQEMLRQTGVTALPLNTIQTQNAPQQQTNISRLGSMSNAGITDSGDCFGLATVVVYICIWFVILQLQT